MNRQLFDRLSRRLTHLEGRRSLLHAAIFAPVAAGLAVASDGEVKRKRKRKRCKPPRIKCGKKCFDLQKDDANCGACGAACTDGRSCSGGACVCPADQSFIAGACIPRFGCTLELDTCEVGKKACPGVAGDADGRCHVSAEGEPFCATAEECVSASNSSDCPTIGGQKRILIPCANCGDPGETGQCVLPITQPGNTS